MIVFQRIEEKTSNVSYTAATLSTKTNNYKKTNNMILTGPMIAAAAGYIVNEIKKSKGAKQATDELSTGIWEWVRPIFLKDEKKLIEKIEENPEKYQTAMELAIEKKAENDNDFDNKLAEFIKNAPSEGITVTGNDNQTFQNIRDSEITITKIGRQINQGDGSTYNENK